MSITYGVWPEMSERGKKKAIFGPISDLKAYFTSILKLYTQFQSYMMCNDDIHRGVQWTRPSIPPKTIHLFSQIVYTSGTSKDTLEKQCLIMRTFDYNHI